MSFFPWWSLHRSDSKPFFPFRFPCQSEKNRIYDSFLGQMYTYVVVVELHENSLPELYVNWPQSWLLWREHCTNLRACNKKYQINSQPSRIHPQVNVYLSGTEGGTIPNPQNVVGCYLPSAVLGLSRPGHSFYHARDTINFKPWLTCVMFQCAGVLYCTVTLAGFLPIQASFLTSSPF